MYEKALKTCAGFFITGITRGFIFLPVDQAAANAAILLTTAAIHAG
jgi:hypothetical protein